MGEIAVWRAEVGHAAGVARIEYRPVRPDEVAEWCVCVNRAEAYDRVPRWC